MYSVRILGAGGSVVGFAPIDCSIISGKRSRGIAGYLCSTVRKVSMLRGMCSPDCRRLFGRLKAIFVFNFGKTKEL